jgi:hypothetical protein
MSFLRVPSGDPGPKGVVPPPDDEVFAGEYPALWEYLTAAEFPGGKPRQLSTLMVLVEDGVWKGCLNDRALDRSAWASGDSLERVLARLEASLASDSAEWRRRPAGPSKRK